MYNLSLIFLNKNDDKINFAGVQGAITDALNAPLNIEQIKESHFQLSTYPNPVNNTLNVSYTKTNTSSVVYSILDVSGKVVIQENKLTPIIDVSALSNANYFLKVSSERATESIPFVVSH